MDRSESDGSAFDIVLRGYDRRQVDERLRRIGADLAAAQQTARVAQERAATTEKEMARLRAQGPQAAQPPPRDQSPSFGERVERILRLAEEEADEVRERATEEAGGTVQEARAEAQRVVAEAGSVAKQRQEESERELRRLQGLRDEVLHRLHGTRSLLEEHLGTGPQPSGRAASAATEKIEAPNPTRGAPDEHAQQDHRQGPAVRTAEPRQGPGHDRQGGPVR